MNCVSSDFVPRSSIRFWEEDVPAGHELRLPEEPEGDQQTDEADHGSLVELHGPQRLVAATQAAAGGRDPGRVGRVTPEHIHQNPVSQETELRSSVQMLNGIQNQWGFAWTHAPLENCTATLAKVLS